MRLTGTAAVVYMALSLAFTVWFFYLLYRIAVHVNAWPF